MYELYLQGYDLICGSRYMTGGKLIGGPFFKQLLSRISGLTLHYFRGVPTHDATNSFKLYDAQMVRELRVESVAGFELGLELTVKAFLNGYPHRRDSQRVARPHRRHVALPGDALDAALPEVVFLRLPLRIKPPRTPEAEGCEEPLKKSR